MKKALSLDLRERIVEACEGKEGTREEVARRFKVSLGMVKKLLMQKKRTGDVGARYRFCGRKGRLMSEHGEELKELILREPDVTLAEMKERLGLGCTIGAIHWMVGKMGLTYKKRRCARANRSEQTSDRRAKRGKAGSTSLKGKGSFSLMNRRRRQT
jgi:transposase